MELKETVKLLHIIWIGQVWIVAKGGSERQ